MNARDKLIKARAQLVLDQPFFGSLALRLVLVEDEQAATAYQTRMECLTLSSWINDYHTDVQRRGMSKRTYDEKVSAFRRLVAFTIKGSRPFAPDIPTPLPGFKSRYTLTACLMAVGQRCFKRPQESSGCLAMGVKTASQSGLRGKTQFLPYLPRITLG